MSVTWKDDEELFKITRNELFTALVGDILDQNGFLHQFLSARIKPLDPCMVVIGRAMPVLEADISDVVIEPGQNPALDKPFGLTFHALDDLKPNEVYICAGASHKYALWGGLMSNRAMKLKAAGAVMDGYSRDTPEILSLGFPTFSAGTYAQDQGPRGKVIDYRVPINFNGIPVNPGDIVFGDRDGVVIVPRKVEQEVFSGAIEKARGEKKVRKALEGGMGAVEAFEKFGIM